jgi:hypothetical protein
MEAIVLKRRCPNYKFDRRGLKKVKGVPKDQLNALVDKVEISTNFRREIQMNKRIIKCNAFIAIVLVVLCIVAASKSADTSSKPTETTEQLEQQMGLSFMKNSSYEFVHQSLKQKSEESKRAIERAISEYNKTSAIGDDEKTAQILLRTYNSINRKNTLPKLLCILIWLLLTCPLMLYTKIRNDQRVAYKNVSSLLIIENEMYFCKRGYLWSIDHHVSKLKLIKTHDPKSFEVEELRKNSVEIVQEEGENAPIKIKSSSQEKTAEEVAVKDEITEEKEEAQKPSGYPPMQYGPPFMMNPMYPPMNYYPWGFPPQANFQHPMPIYPHFNPMMQNINYYQQVQPPNADFQPDFLEVTLKDKEVFGKPPMKNQGMKETSETGDESDDNDEESDSNASSSKHRSFGKKRKMNPDSGSVAAKFQTVKAIK